MRHISHMREPNTLSNLKGNPVAVALPKGVQDEDAARRLWKARRLGRKFFPRRAETGSARGFGGGELTLGDPLPGYPSAQVSGSVGWPEFARNVGPGFSAQSDTGGRRTAAGVESCLRDSTCGRMPR